MNLTSNSLKVVLVFILLISFNIIYASQLYWVGGQGNWTNPARWSTTSGGAPGSVIPDENTNAVFDANSGLSTGDNVNIPGGSHNVEDLIVTGFAADFRLRFIGGVSDPTEMNVYGDLRLLTTHSVVYVGSAIHKWIFHGKETGSQEIKSSGRNLHYVEFPNDDVDYHLNSNLLATDRVEYVGGDITTNGFNITTAFFHSKNNGTAANSQKNFDGGESKIICDVFDTLLTYGAFNLTGTCTIVTKKFIGGPSQPNDLSLYSKIVLKDYEPGLISLDNNFKCEECHIDTLVIDNIYQTRLYVGFIIEDQLEVINSESLVSISGINSFDHEITINGDVIVPTSTGCNDRTVFYAEVNDFILVKRDSGTLSISDAVLKDLKSEGSANFEINNSILFGTSSGWTAVNPPISLTYVWKGNSGVNDYWDNPDNWQLSDGSNNGCIPSAVDNVLVNNSAVNSLRIAQGHNAQCNDFTWIRSISDSLILENSELSIGGDVFFHNSATVSATGFASLILDSRTNNFIETNGVDLPDLYLKGFEGNWKLKDDVNCDVISFSSGIFSTQNYNIETNLFVIISSSEKTLTLGSSHILVNGRLSLAPFDNLSLTINEGDSFIECNEIDYKDVTLHNVQLNNSIPIELGFSELNLNELTLNGSADVTSLNNITVSKLVLNQDNTNLYLDPNMTLEVYEEIISLSTSNTPPAIKSLVSNEQVDLKKETGNLCVSGNIAFQDINADMTGAFHTPNGTDDGNNSNIDFSNSTILTPLYWIGNTGIWDTKSNWSNVSGGCPVNKDPNTALKLIFDDKSFISSTDVVELTALTNCKTMEFNNLLHPANFDVQVRLNPLQIYVNDAEVNFAGAKMYVQNQTVVNDGGVLSLDITEGDGPKFDTPILEINDGGSVEVQSNTLLIVRD